MTNFKGRKLNLERKIQYDFSHHLAIIPTEIAISFKSKNLLLN